MALLPVIPSVVQALPSLQEVGQEDGGSQVSPFSTTPLPQVDEQSESVFALHPAGQQPSPATHVAPVGFKVQAVLLFVGVHCWHGLFGSAAPAE